MDNGGDRPLGRRGFILDLQPSLNTTQWVLKRRTWWSGQRRDQVLAHGSLNYDVRPRQPRDIIRDLRRIADDLERRTGNSAASAAPEPPRGGYGGDQPLPGVQMVDYARLIGGSSLDMNR